MYFFQFKPKFRQINVLPQILKTFHMSNFLYIKINETISFEIHLKYLVLDETEKKRCFLITKNIFVFL